MITVNDLSELMQVFGLGFAIGGGGAVAMFILSLIINTFYAVADS